MDHKNSFSASYAAAGVDITAGYRAVELMKKHVARTRNSGCLDDVGGFGGCFGLGAFAGMEEPVLVSGTDGCGTKVKLAMLMDKHDTIGIDAVAMCVNDIICCGAKPLFFLDYIACGKNIPEKIAEIVGGVAEGCVQSGAALIGGETAEHPGLMPVDEYDLAGFAVGIVDKKRDSVSLADLRDTFHVGDISEVVGRGDVHRQNFLFRLRQGALYVLGSYMTRAKMARVRRVHKFRIYVKKRRRIYKRTVHVSCRKHRFFAEFFHSNGKHCRNCKGRALGGVEAVSCAKKPRSVVFTLGNYSICGIEHVGTRNLGDVKAFDTERTAPLVSGHMKPRTLFFRVFFNKIVYGSSHSIPLLKKIV